MISSNFIFNFDSISDAKIVFESLDPEIKNKIPKTDIKAARLNKTISLDIEAKDISSLRAAINSYLRWINTALNVKKTI